jgi:hypothetical protein
MIKERNNILSKVVICLVVGGTLFFIGSFFSLYYLPSYLDRMSSDGKAFEQSCIKLSGEEYRETESFDFPGFCFESCGEGCTHAVKCTEHHFQSFKSNKSLTITQKPGAPEGWYCNLTLNENNIMFTKIDYMLD